MDGLQSPIYTAALAAGLIISQTVLMLSVGAYRARTQKSIGMDGDVTLERLVRRHGNFVENAAIFTIALALYELLNGQTLFVLTIASAFALARLLHAIGFSSHAGSHLIGVKEGQRAFLIMRAAGAGLTALSSLALGIALLIDLLLTG